MSSDLTKKNIMALSEGLKMVRARNLELTEMYQQTMDQLTMVLTQQTLMQKHINMLMAMKGLGATSGNNS